MSTTYEGHDPFLIVGSTGAIEISMAGASAADVLHLRRGDRVEIIRS
jgi:S-adenosylmethionine hydrolase